MKGIKRVSNLLALCFGINIFSQCLLVVLLVSRHSICEVTQELLIPGANNGVLYGNET